MKHRNLYTIILFVLRLPFLSSCASMTWGIVEEVMDRGEEVKDTMSEDWQVLSHEIDVYCDGESPNF